MQAFALQFTLTFIMYILVARWWVGPALDKRPMNEALAMLCSFHGLRSVGMALLAPGAVDPTIPMSFRMATAYGDYASGVLGVVAAILLMQKSSLATGAAWLFSVVGIGDLIVAVGHGSVLHVFDHPLGASWFAVTVYVPAAYVTHAMVVMRLLRKAEAPAPAE